MSSIHVPTRQSRYHRVFCAICLGIAFILQVAKAASVDPVAFHEKWWGERLTCPAGSSFVWNDADGTMESRTLGHPGRPKGAIGMLPTMLNAIRDGQFGITFERDGLRARVDLRRE